VGRFYIATGTSRYQDPALNLPTVETDLTAISAALESVGMMRAEANPALNPAGEELRALKSWFEQRQPIDDIVLYYVGHGKNDDQHYLVLQNEELASLELVRTFARNPIARRILFVLDTCESGNASLDLSQHWKDFEDRFESAGAHLTLVTSCRSNKEAKAGAFTPAFASALRHELTLPGRNSPRISISELLDSFQSKLPPWQKTSVDSFPSTYNGMPCFDFPNTGSNPDVPEGIDLESQRRLLERQTHWDDRVRYFTGRARALSEIDRFLTGDKSGVVVVTGDPGSGKSAVLAHYALSSSIDFSIHAKGRDLAKMIQIVCDATKIPQTDPLVASEESRAKALAELLGQSGKRWTIVIDALDEALRPEETTRSLLAGLAKCPNIRLLIGTRPDTVRRTGQRFQSLGSAAAEIDLDSDRYFGPEDIETYARTRILEAGPYVGNEALASDAARAVARKSARTFLIAKLECDGLVRLPQPLTGDQIWDSTVPSDVKAAFSEYLDRFPDETVRRDVYRVLQPLAFAFGQGLPSPVWEQIAQALAGEPITIARIRELLHLAGAYVVEAVEDGSSVYRLFHQQFAEYFSDRADARDCHSRITTALLPKNWTQAPYYTRRYLALHAAEGGRLDELLEIPAFLVVADPGILKRVIGRDLAVRNASVYSVSSHLLDTSLAERAATLALAATKFAYHELSDNLKPFGAACPWWTRAAQWQISPHFVIRGAHDPVRTVAVGVRNGRTVIATGGNDGAIRLWDCETLEPVGSPLQSFGPGSYSIEVTIILGPKPYMLAFNRGEQVRGWDLETLAPLTIPHPYFELLGWSAAGGQTFAVCETRDRRIEIRSAEGWNLFRKPFFPPSYSSYRSGVWVVAERQGHLIILGFDNSEVHAFDLVTLDRVGSFREKRCSAVASGVYAGTSVVVTGTVDGSVSLWSSESFERLAGPLYGHQTFVDGLAIGEWKGTPFIVSAGRDGSIRIWHQPLLSNTRFEVPIAVSNVSALATVPRDGKVSIITGGREQPVRVWDLQTLEPVASANNPDSSIVVVAERHGRSIILVGGKQKLHILDLETLKYLIKAPHVNLFFAEISAITVGTRKGRSVVISSSGKGTIVVRDLEKWFTVGKPIEFEEPNIGGDLKVTSLVLAELQGRSTLLSAGFDGIIRVWDLGNVKKSRTAMVGHEGVIFDVAVYQFQPGRTVVASVSSDRTVRLWDLESRAQLGSPLRGHNSQVHGVAFGKWRSRPVVVSGAMDGTIRIWDVETHSQMAVVSIDSHVFRVQLCGNIIVAGCARGLATVDLR
jgi:WD40 repeat protein